MLTDSPRMILLPLIQYGFMNNSACKGGAVWASTSVTISSDLIFSGNKAIDYSDENNIEDVTGGAIRTNEITINASPYFVENSAGKQGG